VAGGELIEQAAKLAPGESWLPSPLRETHFRIEDRQPLFSQFVNVDE
jgi:hypothetical protein